MDRQFESGVRRNFLLDLLDQRLMQGAQWSADTLCRGVLVTQSELAQRLLMAERTTETPPQNPSARHSGGNVENDIHVQTPCL